ncbi:MAG: hypothetical protein RDV41_01065 [Planctomycetota bacterium]|nr:hypothetical protein [Planctomycetota bacterium]
MNWDVVRAILDSAAFLCFLSILGYFWQKYFIEPRQAIQDLIGEIDADLAFYANIWANPGSAKAELISAASEALRRRAVDLRARVRKLGPRRFPWWSCLPTRADLREACSLLIGLSNSLAFPPGGALGDTASRNRDTETRIRKLLGILETGM